MLRDFNRDERERDVTLVALTRLEVDSVFDARLEVHDGVEEALAVSAVGDDLIKSRDALVVSIIGDLGTDAPATNWVEANLTALPLTRSLAVFVFLRKSRRSESHEGHEGHNGDDLGVHERQ